MASFIQTVSEVLRAPLIGLETLHPHVTPPLAPPHHDVLWLSDPHNFVTIWNAKKNNVNTLYLYRLNTACHKPRLYGTFRPSSCLSIDRSVVDGSLMRHASKQARGLAVCAFPFAGCGERARVPSRQTPTIIHISIIGIQIFDGRSRRSQCSHTHRHRLIKSSVI